MVFMSLYHVLCSLLENFENYLKYLNSEEGSTDDSVFDNNDMMMITRGGRHR